MAPQYKLTYFPAQALGEPIRWMLSYGNLEFEDYRFKREDFVAQIKPNCPFGKVPLLEFDGKVLHQHTAICRYLAKKLKLTGKNDDDAVQIDIIVDTFSDFRAILADYFYDQNPVTKAPKLEPIQKTTVPYYLTKFEKIVKDNNGYFVNGQLTWADIYYTSISEYLQLMSGNGIDFSKYPNLAALKAKVEQIPQIKAWIAKRPKDA